MSRVQKVQIHPNSSPKLENRPPIIHISNLPVSTPCSSYRSMSITTLNSSVRNKYIMKRFAHDLTQFALPQISSKYKLDNKSTLSVKGRSISRLSCSTTSSTSRKSFSEEKGSEVTKTICLEGCRYDVVRRIALELQFCEVTETDFWNILWTDSPISMEKAHDMRRLQQQNCQQSFWGPTRDAQKTNHFPGMHEICRKDRLAKNLNRMQKMFPEDYQFYPRTWSLPSDIPELISYFRLHKSQVIICKPDAGCQGKGIFLVRNLKKMNPFAKLIAQIYIPNPLLIDGFKFDLRIYILITSCDPLRMYIYNEGIARFATVKYAAPNDHNVDVVFMHLTNYSLNKYSHSYASDPEGSKRKLSTVYGYLLEKGFNVEKLVENIDDIVIKTVMAAQPTLRQFYHACFPQGNPGGCNCFEILGFDILIDDTLKPWLLEVNLSPSFNLDLTVDAEVKEALLRDTFNKIFLGTARDKSASPSSPGSQLGSVYRCSSDIEIMDKAGNNIPLTLQKQYYHEQLKQGNFRLIYPTDNCYKYAEFLNPLMNIPSANEIPVPISRRGTSLPPLTSDTTTEEPPNVKVTPKVPYQPQIQAPQHRKVIVHSPRAPNVWGASSTMPSTARPPVTFKPTNEATSPNTSGGSDSSFISPFNQLSTNAGFEKRGPSNRATTKTAPKVVTKTETEATNKKRSTKKKKKEPEVVHAVTSNPSPRRGQHKVKVAKLINELGTSERIIVNVQDGLRPFNRTLARANSLHASARKFEGQYESSDPRKVGDNLIQRQVTQQPVPTAVRAVTDEKFPNDSIPDDPQSIELSKPLTDVNLSEHYANDDRNRMFSTIRGPGTIRSEPTGNACKSLEPTVQAPRPNVPTTKNKLVEEWILNGVNSQARRKSKAKNQQKPPAAENLKWDIFDNKDTLRKPKVNPTQQCLKRSDKQSTLSLPVLAHEEDDRKEMLKHREKEIRQLGIERKIFEMMQETGSLTMEEDLIYNKIFSEEEFLANRNGESTLFQPSVHSVGQSPRPSPPD